MGDVGFNLSQNNIDVLSATDKQMVMTSKLNSIKIVNSGLLQHTQLGASETISIPHSLSYIPGYMFFVKNPGETDRWYGSVGESPDIDRWWDLGSDTTDLSIFLDGVASDPWEIKYFFFADEGTTGLGTGNITPQDSGIKISQPGVNVKSANDSELVFSSKMEAVKIIEIIDQTITYTTSPARAEVEIDHNLGFTPAFYGMVEMPFATGVDPPFGTKYYTIPFMQVGTTEVGCWATATKIGFFVENVANTTFNFHIAILGNKIE